MFIVMLNILFFYNLKFFFDVITILLLYVLHDKFDTKSETNIQNNDKIRINQNDVVILLLFHR